MPRPSLAPTSFAGSISSQVGLSHDFTLSKIPSAGKLSTRVVLNDAAAVEVKVKRIVVNQIVPVTFTPPDPLPGGVEPEPQTELTLVPLREGDGTTPIEVEAGNIATIELAANNLVAGFEQIGGTLIVTGDTWDPISASLTYVPDTDVLTTFAKVELTARQGELATIDIVVQSISGPPVEVTYELTADAQADGIQMDAPTLQLNPGEAKSATLSFRVRRDCPVGRKFVHVARRGGGLVDLDRVIQLDVFPAPVTFPGPSTAEIRNQILAKYAQLGQHKSRLGLPINSQMPLVSTEQDARIEFRGGNIRRLASNGQIIAESQLVCEVWWMGLECQIRQEGTDEVYGGVGILIPGSGLASSEQFPDEEGGTWSMGPGGLRVQNTARLLYKGPPMDLVLSFVICEHDSGDTTEVKKKIAAAIAKAAQSLAALVGVPAEAAAAGDGFLNDLTLGVVQGVADLFGINDDLYAPQQLRVRWADIQRNAFVRQTLRRNDDPRTIEFTHSIIATGVDEGGDRGQYAAFFDFRVNKESEKL